MKLFPIFIPRFDWDISLFMSLSGDIDWIWECSEIPSNIPLCMDLLDSLIRFVRDFNSLSHLCFSRLVESLFCSYREQNLEFSYSEFWQAHRSNFIGFFVFLRESVNSYVITRWSKFGEVYASFRSFYCFVFYISKDASYPSSL